MIRSYTVIVVEMVSDGFDTIKAAIRKIDIPPKDVLALTQLVDKERKLFYTYLIIRSIDHTTAKMFVESGNNIIDQLEDEVNKLLQSDLPFVGIMFQVLSYVDWRKVKTVLKHKGAENGEQCNHDGKQSSNALTEGGKCNASN